MCLVIVSSGITPSGHSQRPGHEQPHVHQQGMMLLTKRVTRNERKVSSLSQVSRNNQGWSQPGVLSGYPCSGDDFWQGSRDGGEPGIEPWPPACQASLSNPNSNQDLICMCKREPLSQNHPGICSSKMIRLNKCNEWVFLVI